MYKTSGRVAFFFHSKMTGLALLVIPAILLDSLHGGTALRCRVSSQQTDDQFKKILHVCRQRSSGRDVDDYDRSSEDSNDSDNSASIEDVFDKRLFLRDNNNNNDNNNRRSSTSSYGDWNNDRNGQSSNGGNDRFRRSNRTRGYSGWQDRNVGDYRGSMSQNDRRTTSTDAYNNDHNNGQEQACTIQCFFNELNVVDNRGFPDRRAVTNLMTQNIQDPELTDFIEESITECFHFLNSGGQKDKCTFSQSFLACLAEKSKERCEDWE